ncbi:MAG: hypothetical protein KME47_08970 [Nodosilinea sp. WJT8-NPBG4]|nr:hypothetical protein [Nodosilinea sp. WJT8-NPBG4]
MNFALVDSKPPAPIVYVWLNHRRDRVVITNYPQGILEVTYAHRIICR